MAFRGYMITFGFALYSGGIACIALIFETIAEGRRRSPQVLAAAHSPDEQQHCCRRFLAKDNGVFSANICRPLMDPLKSFESAPTGGPDRVPAVLDPGVY
ncbi:hypothetical protein B0H12DRAFT_131664 [Mycena haematopus]|nr:hypothetical protein B0H12DRAFT_131664 [Mycena haematopus]